MRNKRYAHRFPMAMLALVILCVGLAAWGVSGEIRIAKLNERIDAMSISTFFDAEDEQPELDEAQSNAIAAEFDGGKVTVGEVADEYALVCAYYEMMGMDAADYADDAKTAVLDGAIEEKILENKAKELGVFDLTDEQQSEIAQRVQEEYEENIEYYKVFRDGEGKSDDEVRAETIAYLNENGYSYDSMLDEAQKDAWKDQLFDAVTKDMSVTDEQLREFYETQAQSAELSYSADFAAYEMDAQGERIMLWNPEGVRQVEAILIPFDADQGVEYLTLQAALEEGDSSKLDALNTLYEALMPKAQEALSRAEAGEDFAALMQEYGDAGITRVSAKSSFCGDAFRDAAMALANPNDISAPVQTDGGICIIRYVGDVPSGRAAFEDVKDELLENYQAELKSSYYNSTVMGWIQQANVQYHLDAF